MVLPNLVEVLPNSPQVLLVVLLLPTVRLLAVLPSLVHFPVLLEVVLPSLVHSLDPLEVVLPSLVVVPKHLEVVHPNHSHHLQKEEEAPIDFHRPNPRLAVGLMVLLEVLPTKQEEVHPSFLVMPVGRWVALSQVARQALQFLAVGPIDFHLMLVDLPIHLVALQTMVVADPTGYQVLHRPILLLLRVMVLPIDFLLLLLLLPIDFLLLLPTDFLLQVVLMEVHFWWSA